MLRLLAELSASFGLLDVFRYVTFRTGGAVATAYLVLWFAPQVAAVLRTRLATPQGFRAAGPQRSRIGNSGWLTTKALMIVAGVLVATLLWANLANPYVWGGVVIIVALGAISLYDDDDTRLALVMIAAFALGYFAYLTGNVIFANYLGLPFLPGAGELVIVCGALIGAALPVLWHRV